MEKFYAFIINPNSGNKKGKKLGVEIQSEIKNKQIPADFFFTKGTGHAIEIVNNLSDKYSHVIAVGGDGTINEVVNGLMQSNHSFIFGVIPCGTGNDFIKMIGMSKDGKIAISQIIENQIMLVDVGTVKTENTSHYFINGLGIGFDAVAADKANKLKSLGALSYFYAVLKTLFTYKEPLIDLTIDNKQVHLPLFLANFGNGYSAGGMFQLSPGALLDDGLFHVTFISGIRFLRVLKVMPKVLKGQHIHEKEVQVFVTDQAEIKSTEYLSIHADGEIIDTKAKYISINIISKRISVIHSVVNK